nr:hypothetical protein [Escherichia coli]
MHYFFKNERLCKEVALNRNGLNKYIYDKYENGLEEYVDKIVLGIEPCDIKSPFESYNIIDVVFYSYDSQYQKDMLYCIDNLSQNIKKYIERKIRDASDGMAEFNKWLDFNSPWEAEIYSGKTKDKEVRNIESLEEQKELVNIYNKDKSVEINLFYLGGNNEINWEQVKKMFDKYILNSNYLSLNANKNNIDRILNEVVNIVDDYTKKFSLYDF